MERNLSFWSLSVAEAGVRAMGSTLSLILNLPNCLILRLITSLNFNAVIISDKSFSDGIRLEQSGGHFYDL